MIKFTTGNLLGAEVEALVNTVNTVGVMGKGIALMFKEAFPDNFEAYAKACKRDEIQLGKMFVTERQSMVGPRWIINFPTKGHWRYPSKLGWIENGLKDLRKFLSENHVKSVAIPPLGSGNGGLDWSQVRAMIISELEELRDIEITIFEPTDLYQNVAKRRGVEKLTPARALVAELVRRYWVLGFECTLLEIQKLAYFAERCTEALCPTNELAFQFKANKFGPYTSRITHLLDSLDGSYLHCGKRLADAGPFDVVWFDDAKKDLVATYMRSDGKAWLPALEATAAIIDGFESPLGMEALATVDWLIHHQRVQATRDDIKLNLKSWPGGTSSAQRKLRIFDDHLIDLAIERLRERAPIPRTRSN